VLEEGMPIGHADADAGMELSPSTLWRWVGTLGGLSEAEPRLLDLVKQKDPSTVLFRALAGVRIRAGKYRSEGRRRLLAACWRLALVEAEHVRLFAVSVFTEFATRSGFR
jgi:hypothetical protein